jgi:hypothetical protein
MEMAYERLRKGTDGHPSSCFSLQPTQTIVKSPAGIGSAGPAVHFKHRVATIAVPPMIQRVFSSSKKKPTASGI